MQLHLNTAYLDPSTMTSPNLFKSTSNTITSSSATHLYAYGTSSHLSPDPYLLINIPPKRKSHFAPSFFQSFHPFPLSPLPNHQKITRISSLSQFRASIIPPSYSLQEISSLHLTHYTFSHQHLPDSQLSTPIFRLHASNNST